MPKPAAARTARPIREPSTVPRRCSRATALTVELARTAEEDPRPLAGPEELDPGFVSPAPTAADAGPPADCEVVALTGTESEAAATRPDPLSRCSRLRSLRMSEAPW